MSVYLEDTAEFNSLFSLSIPLEVYDFAGDFV